MKRWAARAAAMLFAAQLGGCVYSDSLRNDAIWPARGPDGAAPRPAVFYATDRELLGGTFTLHWGASFHCGRAVLTLSPQQGFEVAAGDAETLAPQVCDSPEAITAFAGTVAAAARQAGCGSLFLMVHGYNTTFRSALLRVGQVALDMGWHCPTLLFSWSSEGKFDRYAADIERSGFAVPTLIALLRSVGATGLKVELLAHSMGARVTMASLGALCEHQARIVDQLILAAPDVGVELYNDDFGHLLRRAAPCIGRTTLYASDNDMALIGSESVHGGIARAGRTPIRNLQYESGYGGPVDIVDASLAPGDPTGHGYFALSYEMTDDMTAVLAGRSLAERAAGGTLRCRDTAGSPCAGGGGRYVLFVTPERRPDWTSRLLRHILPLILPLE